MGNRPVSWLLALLLVACGCAGEEPGTPAVALVDYVEAASDRDADRVEELLSSRFKRRSDLGDSQLESLVQAVGEDVRGVGDHVLFTQPLGDDVAVVALESASRPGAFAQPLVLEGEDWRVEPFGLDLVYGTSAASSSLPSPPRKLEFGVNAPAERKDGVQPRLWLDGLALDLSRTKTESPVTFVARPPPLDSGRHTVVAYAEVEDRRAAIAWTFTVAG